MTDLNAEQPAGWVFYDGECAFCVGWVQRVERPLARHGFALIPLQTPWVRESLSLDKTALLKEMRLKLADGHVLGGADAAVAAARYIWWLWPLWLIAQIPGTRPLLRKGYGIIAANRHCRSGACRVPRRNAWLDWLPLVTLPPAAIAFRNPFSDWVFMWLLAFAIFFGCKWLTWRRAKHLAADSFHSLAYLFGWPGMDAKDFLTNLPAKLPDFKDWLSASAKTLLGMSALLLAVSRVGSDSPLIIGWLGMFGMVMLLHFGLFHVLALAWQAVGVAARPLMRSPLLATSLADFWGERWNTAFNKLAHDLAFRPVARRAGVSWATLGVFAISGMVHDLVISLPARGGYGLPTAYFALQGAAVLFERSKPGRALGLGHGWRGWLFMFTVTAVPAFWLFHPPFIHHVILPMLHALGTTWNTP